MHRYVDRFRLARVQGVGQHRHGLDREILRLAVPAFLALVAEPLYLLADSAIVGRLGIDGIWLAVLIGAAATALGIPLTRWLVGLYRPGSSVADQAASYLHVGWLGNAGGGSPGI